MPLYLFENNKTGELREVFFRMLDEKIYNGEDGTELDIWERRFFVPQASIDTKIDPESNVNFIEKTGNKKGTMQDIWNASKEASDKREQIMGKDPIKEEYIKKWKKNRKGQRLHPSEVSKNKNSEIVIK